METILPSVIFLSMVVGVLSVVMPRMATETKIFLQQLPESLDTVHGRLECPYSVFLLNLLQFPAHKGKIITVLLNLHPVAGGDVSFAEHHQVVNIITCLKQKSSYG